MRASSLYNASEISISISKLNVSSINHEALTECSPMGELYVQVLVKCLRMVHTSEEPFLHSATKDSHPGEVCVYI